MNLRFQMIDTDTGEMLANSYCQYALNFQDKKDVGFKKCLAWVQSCVRGIRCHNHDNIELRIGFAKEKAPEFLNLQIDGIDVY